MSGGAGGRGAEVTDANRRAGPGFVRQRGIPGALPEGGAAPRALWCPVFSQPTAGPRRGTNLFAPHATPYHGGPARGYSSVGRALQSHCRGQEFESPYLHPKRRPQTSRRRGAGAVLVSPACPAGAHVPQHDARTGCPSEDDSASAPGPSARAGRRTRGPKTSQTRAAGGHARMPRSLAQGALRGGPNSKACRGLGLVEAGARNLPCGGSRPPLSFHRPTERPMRSRPFSRPRLPLRGLTRADACVVLPY